jgi:hypothetical protein
MKFGRTNIIVGALMLLAGAIGGLALGATFDKYAAKDGYHVLTLTRFYLREGHSHTMPFALMNLIVGLLIDRLALSDRLKRACSWLAVIAFLLPLGLAGKGASGASPDFPPFGILGALAFMGVMVLLALGALRTRN